MRSTYIKPISIGLIICLGIIIYSNTFHCGFHLDDIFFITDNSSIKDISDLQSIWNFLPCRFIFYLSMALNYHFNGLDVFGYHVVNLTVHIISAILVWWLVLLTFSTLAMNEESTVNNIIKKKSSNKLNRSLPNVKLPQEETILRHANLMALLAGLIFVSHPIQTQGVTYIMQRTASLATLFYLASLCFYVKSRLLFIGRTQDPPLRIIFYICSLITAVLAMFTKEITITLPLMILLYEICFLKNKGTLNWRYMAPFLLTLLIIPLTMFLTKSGNAMSSREMQSALQGATKISSSSYLLTQFSVIVAYIRLLFFPFNQNLDYDFPISNSLFEWPTLFSFLFLILIIYFAIRLFSKHRLMSFSIFWFFLTLLPESSIFPIKDVIFEHRLYLPLVGFSIFLVSGVYYGIGFLYRHSERRSSCRTFASCSEESKGPLRSFTSFRMTISLLILIIAGYSFLTYQRNKVWLDDFTLWNDVILKSPHKARPYSYRGLAYFNQGDLSQSLSDYNKALEIDPNDVQTYNNRGNTYNQLGRFTEAISDYSKAINLGAQYTQIYNNRALIYSKQGKFDLAISDYNKALEIDPNFVGVYANRGSSYAQEGKFTEALSDFNKAIEINPHNPQAFYNLGLIYSRQGNFNQAVLEYSKAIEINPNYADAYNNEAVSYYQLKEYENAWNNVEKAQALGYAVNPGFIKALKEALGPSS